MARTALAGYSIGTSHLAAGTVCQDCARLIEHRSGAICAALSDGMGTAPRSEEGSRIAVDVALALLTEWLAGEIALGQAEADDMVPSEERVQEAGRAILARAQAEAKIRADELGCGVSDLKCTLLALVWTPEWLACISVGDAFLAARQSGERHYELLMPPDRDEFENVSCSILGTDAAGRLRCKFWRRSFSFVCASTDGLMGLALRPHPWEPHTPFFRLIELQVAVDGADEERIKRFLSLPQVTEKSDDDLSLICIRADEVASEVAKPSAEAVPVEPGQSVDVQA